VPLTEQAVRQAFVVALQAYRRHEDVAPGMQVPLPLHVAAWVSVELPWRHEAAAQVVPER
jgi:hypothetical protein